MTMHMSTFSFINDETSAHIVIDVPYGTSLMITVHENDTMATAGLDIEDVEALIEELSAALKKMKSFDAAEDKDAWIDANP